MTTSALTSVECADFVAGGERDGVRLQVHLRGNADMRAKEKLDAFMAVIDGEASSGPTEEVVVDLRGLAFMNSSCLKILVSWLDNVQLRPTADRYRIRFLREPMAHWQSRSLHVLATFAPGLVLVE